MNPRNYRWILGVALLVLSLLGIGPMRGAASVLPIDGGPNPAPFYVVDPPTQGGGGDPTDGGDPDEVVIFIVTPGEPIVVTGAVRSPQTVSSRLSTALAEIRALLFWAGVVR
jgi:hypothetical protein